MILFSSHHRFFSGCSKILGTPRRNAEPEKKFNHIENLKLEKLNFWPIYPRTKVVTIGVDRSTKIKLLTDFSVTLETRRGACGWKLSLNPLFLILKSSIMQFFYPTTTIFVHLDDWFWICVSGTPRFQLSRPVFGSKWSWFQSHKKLIWFTSWVGKGVRWDFGIRGLYDSHVEPELFSCNFEEAVMKKFSAIFPTTTIRSCLFHFSQNILRHVSGSGLRRAYGNDPRVNKRRHSSWRRKTLRRIGGTRRPLSGADSGVFGRLLHRSPTAAWTKRLAFPCRLVECVRACPSKFSRPIVTASAWTSV